ncbi:hypothetical protein ACIBF1_08890 [Spirillospora sp. NPDC050679]
MHFSRCTDPRWTWDIPYIAAAKGGDYQVSGLAQLPVVFGQAGQAWNRYPVRAGTRLSHRCSASHPNAPGRWPRRPVRHRSATRPATPPLSPRRQDVIVQMNVECDQKGIQIGLHMPTAGALLPARTR